MSAIIGFIVMTIVGIAITEIPRAFGKQAADKLYKQATDIYKQISKNQQNLNKLYEAYQKKDTNLANSLLMSSGLGSRAKSIKREMEDAYKKYQSETSKLNAQNAELQTQYNKTMSSAEAGKSGSIGGAIEAGQTTNENEKINTQRAIQNAQQQVVNQNVNGGIQ